MYRKKNMTHYISFPEYINAFQRHTTRYGAKRVKLKSQTSTVRVFTLSGITDIASLYMHNATESIESRPNEQYYFCGNSEY